MIGTSFYDYMHPDDRERSLDVIQKAIMGNREDRGLINRQKTKEGYKTIEWSGAPFFNSDKQYIGFQASGRDITERKLSEEKIKTSLKEKEVLLAEVHHRVKNNMQVIISLLRLQAKRIEDKKYADIFMEAEDRIRSMALIHEQLYQSQDFANIDFGEYAKSLVKGLFISHGVDPSKIRFNVDIKDVSFDLESAVPCGLIISELVSNSLKHAFPRGKEGQISVELRPVSEAELELMVSDDGVGIPEDLDIEQTDTMGLNLVKLLAEHQLDGKITLNRTQGTQIHIKFKRAAYEPRI
jgi:two-component sensor histidine kinase